MRIALASLSIVLAVGAAPSLDAQPCPDATTKGCFDPPFNHLNNSTNQWHTAVWQDEMNQRFNAIHIALIPTPPLRGMVLAWDYGTPLCDRSSPGTQRWSILDPTRFPAGVGAFENFTLTNIPQDGSQNQDLACAGFTWLPNGRLFVAGGTQRYSASPPPPAPCPTHQTGPIVGARLVYTFRPENWNTANPLWQYEAAQVLAAKRWYPTTILADQHVFILRGHIDDSDPYNIQIPDTYERRFVSGLVDPNVYVGPDPSRNGSAYLVYPRVHFLSNAQTFVCGFFPEAAAVVDPAVGWLNKGVSAHLNRAYGTSVLFPNIDARHTDAVMIIGGISIDVPNNTHQVLGSVRICKASAPVAGAFDAAIQGWTWTPIAPAQGSLPDMIHARGYHNAVLLPDASVLVVGGSRSSVGIGMWEREAERFRGGQWQAMATSGTDRGYHQTALLLPSGKVLIAGGELRNFDYEVYSPPYMFQPRPAWQQPPQENVTYGGWYSATVAMPPGAALGKIVLMRPGAVTHHFDSDQRYHELEFEPPFVGSNNALFGIPSNRNALPPGYYTIWLVSTTGVPSEARWIKVQ